MAEGRLNLTFFEVLFEDAGIAEIVLNQKNVEGLSSGKFAPPSAGHSELFIAEKWSFPESDGPSRVSSRTLFLRKPSLPKRAHSRGKIRAYTPN